MLDWLDAIHALTFVVGAVGFLWFWVRTRFWLPRYVHVLAGLGLAVGLGLLSIMPADAPINRSARGAVMKAFLVLIMPALVYAVFILYGGQHAAYGRHRSRPRVRCPYCRSADVHPGERCRTCGQTVTAKGDRQRRV
jgi:hypothetical protein